jgi:2'-5' RNA ligase
MRLFVGIALSAGTLAELAPLVTQIKPKVTGWRWSEPESWHITLQFLGATGVDQYSRLIAQLRAIRSPKVPVQLGGLGVFDRTGIFFVDVQVSPQLADLQKLVTSATAPCGFVAESRPYHPHITLARFEGKNRAQNLPDTSAPAPQFSGFVASEFLLYESVLAPAGDRYAVRGRFPLI